MTAASAPDDALDALDLQQRQGLEAMLFLADEPVGATVIAEILDLDVDVAQRAVEALGERFATEQRGIEIRYAGAGWRMYSAPGARDVLERWALGGRTGRLTQAALETLAVIAYKQPISRQRIGDIRGVGADAAVRSLVARGLVREVGRDEGPGQAVLYGTTTLLLERLGLGSLDELPPLTDYLDETPAPDEPELEGLRALRRRLAHAGGQSNPADDHDVPLPAPRPIGATNAGEIAELTDRLDSAARNAVDRLREVTEPASGTDDA